MAFEFPLSQKYIDFINTVEGVEADFLEGTTMSGKTTVGAGVKFMRMVSRSPMKFHVLAAKSVGVAEKNIITPPNGILDLHKGKATWHSNGDKNNKLPHIKFEDKIIFVFGYNDADQWKNILGGQYGAVYIDEINTADIDFIREIITRNQYLMATLNPDDPYKEVYKEVINRSRPYKKYEMDIPAEIREALCEPPVKGWRYWFFSFNDNLSLTPEMIDKRKRELTPGTKKYKNRILGLRGKATGLIFPNFSSKNLISTRELHEKIDKKEIEIVRVSCGVDTSYSAETTDTTAMIYQLISSDKKVYVVDELVFNNKDRDLNNPIAVSDTITKLIAFLDKNEAEWGFCRDVFIDSAEQATLTELKKYKRTHATPHNFIGAYKKTKIIDRIKLMLNWIENGDYIVCLNCINHIRELGAYSWDDKKPDEPEDRNDHTINSSQYSFLAYKYDIGSTVVKE